MRRFFIGFIIGLVVVPLIAFLFAWSGMVSIATSASPLPLEQKFAHMDEHAQVAREAPKESPVPINEANLIAGSQVYRENCAVCHGLPGQLSSSIARGEYPAPPDLLEGKGVTDDPAGATYWKVANGIRWSGMPGFRSSLNNLEMWQVSLLLANANNLPPSVKQLLAQPAGGE